MKKDVLTTSVRGHLKSAGQNLSDFEKDRHFESLHRLRVDLKKIKAAHAFAEYAFDEKFPTAKLKPLFKEAGAIREIQVHLSMLKQFPHPPKRLVAQLERSEMTLTEFFVVNNAKHRDCLKDFRKKCGLPKEKIDFDTIARYFANMQEVRLQKNDADEMHKYRIRIKRMMYVYYMLPVKNRKKAKLDIKSIEKLQEELGNWHDMHTAIELLSGETVPKRVAEHILKLRQEESNLYETLRNKLIAIPDP